MITQSKPEKSAKNYIPIDYPCDGCKRNLEEDYCPHLCYAIGFYNRLVMKRKLGTLTAEEVENYKQDVLLH